jgi:TonB family protein
MNRLEKKCFITVASVHGLMVVILFVGPAFFVSSQKNSDFKLVTLYSPDQLDKISGGEPQNNVKAAPVSPPSVPVVQQPPVAAPQPPEIPPPQKTESKPEKLKDLDVKQPQKITPDGEDRVIVPKKKQKPKVTITDDELTPNTKTDRTAMQKKALEDARKRAQAEAAADAKQRAELSREIGSMTRSLSKDLSGSTVVKMPDGEGGGGAASVSYRDLIASKYYNAWNPSFNLSEDTPDVTVLLTISRDGSVTGHITKRSGNSNMDKSVQTALDIVSFIEPFPPSFKEQQMTVPVVFNLHVKRQ